MRFLSAPAIWPSVALGTRRGAPRIVAKDTTPSVTGLVELGGGELAVLETPGLANLTGRLVRRNAAFDCLAVLPNVQGKAALSPNRRWLLAGGPYVEGRIGSAVIVDVTAWSVVRTLPLRPPFAWVDEETFVAQTLATAPRVLDVDPGLVLVSRTTLAARCLLPSLPVDEEVACLISGDGSVLFSVTGFARTSAVRVEDGTIVFQRPPSRVVAQGTVYAMAHNEARAEIITVGTGADPVRVLDATAGTDRLRLEPNQPIVRAGLRPPRWFGAVAVHADGRVAIGSNTGLLLEMSCDGTRMTAAQVAPQAIQALAYAEDGSALLIGGNEKSLRVLPLD